MLRRMKDLETGEIRIGASDMTLQFYLLPYLEQFHEQYPNIKVTVSNGPTPETLEALYQGHIDFGIVSTPFETKQAVKSLPVQEIRNVFIAGPKYAAQLKGRKLSYKELLNAPASSWSAIPVRAALWMSFWQSAGFGWSRSLNWPPVR